MALRTPQYTLPSAAAVLVAALGALVAAPAHAQASGLESAALHGGRIIGAAKACGINSERVRRATERVLSAVNAKAGSAAEKTSAAQYFAGGQSAGAEQVRADRSQCNGIHVDFSEMEVKLGRAPRDGDTVAKRGVPVLGALATPSSYTR